MVSSRFIVSILAVAGAAYADNGCSQPKNTIQNQGDATALGSCTTVDGDIVIDEGAPDTITLDGIQQIKGNLQAQKASNLSSLSAKDLETIGGTFLLDGTTALQTLGFPSLTEVQTIAWRAVPLLSELSFTAQVTKADTVNITNTGLNSLSGINLMQVNNFDINNNQYLKTIDTQLGNVTGVLNIAANADGLSVSLPNLEMAYRMAFRQCGSVKIDSLKQVNNTVNFINNDFQSLSAPNLTYVGKDLTFQANDQLKQMKFPQLKTLGGSLKIVNNTKLEDAGGYDKLAAIRGAVTMKGTFSKAALPALNDVRGAFSVATTGDFSCDKFKALGNKVRGKYSCTGNADDSAATGTSTADGASATSTGSAAALGYEVNGFAMLSLSSVLAGLLGLAF